MNFKIKSDGPEITIGTEVFGPTAVDLASVSCLQQDYYSDLFECVKKGDLIILNINDQPVENGVSLISALITLDGSNTNELELLKEDYIAKKRLDDIGFANTILESIDNKYDNRVIDGVNYYRRKRAEMVEKIMDTILTSSEAFYVDKKIKEVKQAILTGDWMTAKQYLEETTVEGVYTQDIKDEFMQEIDAYIANNY